MEALQKIRNFVCRSKDQPKYFFYNWDGHNKRPDCEVHRLDIQNMGLVLRVWSKAPYFF